MHKYLFLLFFFLDSLYAEMAIQNVLLQHCHDSYHNLYRYLKGDKAFAYARVKLGEKDYCVWSHKATSEENAKNSALQACRQQPIDAQCKIVDVNGKWSVKDGAFSMIIPADNTPLSQMQYKKLTNQAKDIVLDECLSLFYTHLQDKGHKVFAYSVDEDGRYACGASKEHQTLRTAALAALKVCEEQRRFMKKKAPKNPCLSFCDGKKILANAEHFKIALHKKANRYMRQDTYLAYVKNAKQYLSDFCLTQYKYYLRDKEHKAFYIAQDTQGNVVCGRSVNKFTIASAKNHALKLCEKSVKTKRLQATCEPFIIEPSK